MSNQVDIPKLQPFKLVEVITRPSKYHSGGINDQLQQELIRAWEEKLIYRAPVERSDPFRLTFSITPFSSLSLQIIDGRGKVYPTTMAVSSAAVAGNTSITGDAMTTFLYKMANYNALTADGTYYLLLTINFDGSTVKQFVSEPFWLKAKHARSLLMEYWHGENRDGIFFEQLPVHFAKRVHGIVRLKAPGSRDTTYEDSATDLQLLDGRAFRNYELVIGGNGQGVTDWEVDNMKDVLNCSVIFMDGTQYRKDDNASWEKAGVDNVPLAGYSIGLREANESQANSHVDPRVKLFTAPAPPYALGSATIYQTGSSAQLVPAVQLGFVVNSAGQETAMIAAMNAALPDQELTGSVVKAGGVVSYANGVGEHYTSADAKFYANSFGFTYTNPGVIGSGPGTIQPILSLVIRRGGGLIDWGDGTVSRIPYATAGINVGHLYTSSVGTPHTVRIFGTMQAFSVTNAYRSGLTGTLPTGLAALSISLGTFAGNAFDFAILAPVLGTLETLNITKAALTGANGFNSVYLPKLKYIDFTQNAFSNQVMSAFVYDAHYNASNHGAGSPALSSGVLSVGLQTTGATLNATGNYYKGLLQGAPYYWTVNS